jgi:predicted nucleic acid-binding protein
VRHDRLLVDTSAWIVSFRRTGAEELKALLRQALERDQVATSPLTILELLQGCRLQQEFDTLRRRLESLEQLSMNALDWERLYGLGFLLRRRGVTVPTIDLLIASLAMEHGYTLLHHDRHFRMIADNSTLVVVDFLGG